MEGIKLFIPSLTKKRKKPAATKFAQVEDFLSAQLQKKKTFQTLNEIKLNVLNQCKYLNITNLIKTKKNLN